MGVLNVTPDSFSDGGDYLDPEAAIARAWKMAQDGAHVIDVGGESSRPGSDPVAADEEMRRVIPVIRAIAGSGGPGLPVSIDTTKASVADAAISAGASIINDISGMTFDADMPRVAAQYGVAVIIMHMRGNPKTMQQDLHYDDLLGEIERFFQERIEAAVAAGVREDLIMIDPGIGFGKTVEHNLEIIRELGKFRSFGRPVVLGPSRKAFIGKILDLPVQERLEGTLAAVVMGMANGADMVRVHDVRAAARAARVADSIKRGEVLA
ncbi:MAG: dihydropteroate synthase [Nitrospirae bacterium]|nr:dihydropteroate synthase [Nitrospirota bacterium]